LEIEILKKAVDFAKTKKWIARLPVFPMVIEVRAVCLAFDVSRCNALIKKFVHLIELN